MNTMDQIMVRYGAGKKLVPIQEFLQLKKLSGFTKKIQTATKALYELNGKKSPLFHFPDFPPDKPLIIDCTTATDEDCEAHYLDGKHVVEFVRDLHENPWLDDISFTETLAHELTHAEQDVPEIIDKKYTGNGLQHHQIRILREATAFAKGEQVRAMLEKRHVPSTSELVQEQIERLKTDFFYRNRWNDECPIHESDTPLTGIPAAFHLSNDLLALICTFPPAPLRPKTQKLEDIRMNPEVTIWYFDKETNGEKYSAEASNLLERLFYSTNPSTLETDRKIICCVLELWPFRKRSYTDICKFEKMFRLKSECPHMTIRKLLEQMDPENKEISPADFPFTPSRTSEINLDDIRQHPERVKDYFFFETSARKCLAEATSLIERLLYVATPKTFQQDLEMIADMLRGKTAKGKPILREDSLKEMFDRCAWLEGTYYWAFLDIAETMVDSKGKKIFPDHFADRAKQMTVSEFSDCLRHYREVMKKPEKTPHSSLRQRLRKGADAGKVQSPKTTSHDPV